MPGAGPRCFIVQNVNRLLQGLAAVILLAVCVLSASVRLFSVIKYESVIHEFDPYFNYRVTQFLTKASCHQYWLLSCNATGRCSSPWSQRPHECQSSCDAIFVSTFDIGLQHCFCRRASTTCGTGSMTEHGTRWGVSLAARCTRYAAVVCLLNFLFAWFCNAAHVCKCLTGFRVCKFGEVQSRDLHRASTVF